MTTKTLDTRATNRFGDFCKVSVIESTPHYLGQNQIMIEPKFASGTGPKLCLSAVDAAALIEVLQSFLNS